MSAAASVPIKIRIHYWNVRGRLQSVRYMLENIAYKHKNVDYKETFEIMDKTNEVWIPKNKNNENISGPFRNLPVFRLNDTHTFAQTLAIGSYESDRNQNMYFSLCLAQFLARTFDLYGKPTPTITDKNIIQTYVDGVVSCAYFDVITHVLTCVYNSLDFENPNEQPYRFTKMIPSALQSLNRLLEKSSTPYFYDQTEPTTADYFAFEAYMIARDYHQKVLAGDEYCQALKRLEQTMKQHPAIANYFAKDLLFKRYTGSPKEKDYMKKHLIYLQNKG